MATFDTGIRQAIFEALAEDRSAPQQLSAEHLLLGILSCENCAAVRLNGASGSHPFMIGLIAEEGGLTERILSRFGITLENFQARTLELYGHPVDDLRLTWLSEVIDAIHRTVSAFDPNGGIDRNVLTKRITAGVIAQLLIGAGTESPAHSDQDIGELRFPPDLERILRRKRITTLRQLLSVTDTDFGLIPGIGPKTVAAVRAALQERGFDFRP